MALVDLTPYYYRKTLAEMRMAKSVSLLEHEWKLLEKKAKQYGFTFKKNKRPNRSEFVAYLLTLPIDKKDARHWRAVYLKEHHKGPGNWEHLNATPDSR